MAAVKQTQLDVAKTLVKAIEAHPEKLAVLSTGDRNVIRTACNIINMPKHSVKNPISEKRVNIIIGRLNNPKFEGSPKKRQMEGKFEKSKGIYEAAFNKPLLEPKEDQRPEGFFGEVLKMYDAHFQKPSLFNKEQDLVVDHDTIRLEKELKRAMAKDLLKGMVARSKEVK